MRYHVRAGFTFGDYPTPASGDAGLFDEMVELVRAAERAGFDSVWVADHLMQTPVVGGREQPMLECYTTLGALAAVTSRMRLGAFVGGAAYRNPGLLAKAVTTLDVISRGRAIFGIGAGWFEGEHDAFGYDFGTVVERFDRLVDVLEIVTSMFTGDTTTYRGPRFAVEDALNRPMPLQPGGPPILIGGSGEKRTLRLVAQYADICNVSGDLARLRHLMDVLDTHCEAVGRDPAEICRTATNPIVLLAPGEEPRDPGIKMSSGAATIIGTRGYVVDRLAAIHAAGIDGLICGCPAWKRDADYVELLAGTVREAFS